jgi:hypothetical protein
MTAPALGLVLWKVYYRKKRKSQAKVAALVETLGDEE